MVSNLPPGVNENNIPGNRPEDAEWEDIFEFISTTADNENLSAEEVKIVFSAAITLMKVVLRKVEKNPLRDKVLELAVNIVMLEDDEEFNQVWSKFQDATIAHVYHG